MATTATPKLGIRLMATADVQKETVFNEATVAFEQLVCRSALAIQDSPPGSPADGDTYIVGTSPSGAWGGYANNIAFYLNGWRFVAPFQKLKFFVTGVSAFYTYSGTGWTQDAAGTPSTLGDLTNVGGSAPSDGDVLTFDAAQNRWMPETPNPGVTVLAGLTDVQITSQSDGQSLVWNATDSKWENATAGGATSLAGLSDVNLGTPTDGQYMVWQSGHAVFQSFSKPPMDLGDLTDVVVTGAQANDVLAFNGAAWGPSPAVITYSFNGMVDGPQTFDGHANDVLVVNEAETAIIYKSMADVLAGTMRLQALTDVAAPADAAVGKFIQLQKTGSDFHYVYAAQTDYSIALNDGGTSVTTALKAVTFTGFTVAEGDEGVVTVTAKNALAFQQGGTPIEGGVSAINFTGGGLGVTLSGTVLNVNVPTPVTQLAALTDVDLSTPPADGQVLKYDGVASKWVPGVGSGGGAGIVPGEYVPATYEFGPFAPPVPGMFPGRFNADTATLTTQAARGLLVQAGAQSSGTRHSVVYRALTLSTAPFQATARVVPSSFSGDGHAGGVVIQRSANGAFAFLALGDSQTDTEAVLRFGWVAADGTETVTSTKNNCYNWLRLGFDGNNIQAWVSGDGLIWQLFGTLDAASTIAGTPDRVGITNRSTDANDGSVGTLVTYWEDPDFPASARIQSGVISLGLGALSDVDLTTAAPTDGQALVYDSASETWKPATASGGTTDYNELSNRPDLRALLTQTVNANSASVAIDTSLGEYVILNLQADVTSLSFTNWPGSGKLGKCTLEVRNTGAYSITWPSALKCVGTKPTVTSGAGKIDRYHVSTGDNGTTVFLDTIGQDYA